VHQLDVAQPGAQLSDLIKTIAPVPEAMSAVDLMSRFNKDRKSIAWVVDEFGGTAGIVSMEDVLEKIFGQIRDEHDADEYVEKQIAEGEYLFSGRLELGYLNDKYGLTFPTDVAETLSGYIIASQGHIPRMKERVIVDRYEFDVLLVSTTRVESVKMRVLK
jgi:CBS domain containing-hemolysin-like protein